jgi:glycosyltransferase involved in cell wall biosynthesis
MMAPRGIKYVSIHGPHGYFIAAKHYMLGFHRRQIPITWQPLVPNQDWAGGFARFAGEGMGDDELDCFCNRKIDYDTVIVHTPPEVYPYWLEAEAGKRILGYTAWEADRLPETWPELLNRMPCVLVPSTWNQEVFRQSGVSSHIGIVPHLYKADIEADCSLVRDIAEKDYVFYAVEEWRARKGLAKTIQTYLNTFRADDPVLLLLKTSSLIDYHSVLTKMKRFRKIYRWLRRLFKVPLDISIRPSAERLVDSLLKKHPNPARIKLITKQISDGQVAGIHQRGDCYISLSSGEGWGLSPFYAAANGHPVIMTGYGGQLDYLPEKDALLVDYRLVPVRDDDHYKLFTADQSWAEPELHHAGRLMRQVFENQQESAVKGGNLRKYIQRQFSEDRVIDLFLEQIARTGSCHG